MHDHGGGASYSWLDRALHRFVLGNEAICELSFELEQYFYPPAQQHQDSLYITGLARAGTTTLMRGIFSCDQFASLTYNDMPFVLAPNLWWKCSQFNAKQRRMQERAHLDGIYVDYDSPEALEEVFWRVHCGKDYIREDGLYVHEVPDAVMELWSKYKNLVCSRYGRHRYLAKNNNHILRLASIQRRSDNTVFLVVFRHPIAQAKSLLRQHKNFLRSDAFVRQYMTWLVHHEFGREHRPFYFLPESKILASPDDVSYWLERWVDAYSYLLRLLQVDNKNIIPVCYERLCEDPGYWRRLCNTINIPHVSFAFQQARTYELHQYGDVAESACQIYRALSDLA